MADNQDILKGIIQLIAIIIVTIIFFSYFSKKTQNLKKLKDFLEKVSAKVKVYKIQDLSEGFIVMNEINLKENRLFKKLLRSSDLGRFSGKFFELEKLGSNKFYQKLKVYLHSIQ